MPIDRKALFAIAWTIARQDQWSRRLPSVRGLFGEALRKAWAEMKRRAELAQKSAATDLQSAASLQTQIRNLENRDVLGVDGLARLSALRAAYAAATNKVSEHEPAPVKGLTHRISPSPRCLNPRHAFTASENSNRINRLSAAVAASS